MTDDGTLGAATQLPASESFFAGKKGEPVALPVAASPIAESHTHLSSLRHIDPALALARDALCGVDFVVDVVDPTDDARDPAALLADLERWRESCDQILAGWGDAGALDVLGGRPRTPRIRFVVGCHPHNARLFDEEARAAMDELLAHPLCCGVGEIGLDYHYDLSPRDVQRAVFEEQLDYARRLDAPVSLHIREAHDDAAPIVRSVTPPAAGAVLHCFDLGPSDAEPFLEMGCYLGIGGAVTFKRSDDTRAAVLSCPPSRIVLETDAPYMAPEPLRGTRCEPAYISVTARFVADLVEEAGITGADAFYRDAHDACLAIFDRPSPVRGAS